MTDASSFGPHSSGDTSSFGFRDVDAKEKVRMVRGVFDSVASNYDLMNDLMSAGVHRLWKDATAARLNPQPGEVIIDCAGGTGDMARRFAKLARAAQLRRGGPDAQIMIMDYNAEMIAAGRTKGGEPEITWNVGDAQRLPLPDACADAYVISFGIRNVTDIPGALREARRVLKPGGRFLCLEFSRPTTTPIRKVYDAWSFHAIPRIGGWSRRPSSRPSPALWTWSWTCAWKRPPPAKWPRSWPRTATCPLRRWSGTGWASGC